MDAGALLERQCLPLGGSLVADRPAGLALQVVTDQHALGAEVARRRIDDLTDLHVGLRGAAEDLVVLLPEPPLELQTHLAGGGVGHGCGRLDEVRREVGVDRREHRERNRRHAVVGLDPARPPRRIVVADTHAAIVLADVAHRGAVDDLVSDAGGQRPRQPVGAADDLQHRLLVLEAEVEIVPACATRAGRRAAAACNAPARRRPEHRRRAAARPCSGPSRRARLCCADTRAAGRDPRR